MPYGVRQQLEDRITELIFELDLAPGEAMPPENQLVERLGAGRNSVREALRALHTRGIVDIRHGYGTYVGSVPFSALEAGLSFRTALSVRGDHADIRNLLEVREVLETGLAGRVLAAYDRIDLAALEKQVAAMERAAEEGRYAPEQDWAFHETLYRPLGNELVLDLLQVFWKVFATVDADLPRAPDAPTSTARWHRGILDALRARDEATLHEAVAGHFRGITARLADPAG